MASHIASVERPNFFVSVLCYATCVAVFEFDYQSDCFNFVFSVYRAFLITEI